MVPHISEATFASHATAQSIERGRAYYQQGRVTSLVWRATTLFAEVEGSEELPYLVCCTFAQDGSITANCTCPYDWGGWCKHIIAACFSLLLRPEAIEERPSLEGLLADLTHEQLHALVLKLAEGNLSLVATIEHTLDLLQPVVTGATAQREATAPPSAGQTTIDLAAARRRIRGAIHRLDRMDSSDAYWHVEAAVNEIRSLLDQLWPLIRAERGDEALPALEAITETYLAEWAKLDDSGGEASTLFFDLGNIWTEAVLSCEMASKQRLAWADRLAAWQKRLSPYGVDDAFDCAVTAARQGWDYQPLQRVLQGTITSQGAWRGEPPPYADDLACTRLAILERRGRLQEYLFLAQAEGQDLAYTIMLVRLDRVQEAIDYGLPVLRTPQDALALATALFEHGEHEQSLRIAQHGLTLEGPEAELARWLREQAVVLNLHELALTAAERTLRAEVTLDNYLRVAELAAEQWPQRRTELLAKASYSHPARAEGWVAIFLHERLFDHAIAVLEVYANPDLITRVIEAVSNERPEWVMHICCQQASSIMDNGQSQNYHRAVQWLKKARDVYYRLQRDAEWRLYLDTLLQRHRRKYTLVPQLEALRE